jgi:hypothetical protein
MKLLYGIIDSDLHAEVLSREPFDCVLFLCELYVQILNAAKHT